MRNPSCLISCSQPGPEGGALAGDRKQGSIIPSSGPVRSPGVTSGASAPVGIAVTGGQVATHTHFTDGILRAGLNYQFH
jgi:hypothetical protein